MIDNPSQRDALTKVMCLGLRVLALRLQPDKEVIVITVRGAGTTFSAGAAIGELSSVLLDPQHDGTRIDHVSLADESITSETNQPSPWWTAPAWEECC